MKDKKIGVVIPAINEEESIALVINDIPDSVRETVVVDNGSTDSTVSRAADAGAVVLHEEERGYGAACLKGIEYLNQKDYDIIVFMDGDYADHPDELTAVVAPILQENYDMVIGSRTIGKREPGALLPQAIFGNRLAGFLIRLFWGYRFTDLGPFRAITASALRELRMQDRNYGWTVEMQIKAARKKMKVKEIPVSYRKRIGESKVTGTLSGTFKASYKILYLIFKYALWSRK